MIWDNGPESGTVETGLDLGSLNGVGGYDEAILQNGHGVVESITDKTMCFPESECRVVNLCKVVSTSKTDGTMQ